MLLKLWEVLWKKTALRTNNRGLWMPQRYTDPAVVDREQDFDAWLTWCRLFSELSMQIRAGVITFSGGNVRKRQSVQCPGTGAFCWWWPLCASWTGAANSKNRGCLRFKCSATSADRVYGCTEIFSGVGEDSGTTATVTVWPIRRGIGGLPVILMRTG